MVANRALLLDFLFQITEQIRMKKVLNCDSKTIAEFLDCRNGGTTVSSADDVVYSRLRYAAHTTEFIDGNITFTA